MITRVIFSSNQRRSRLRSSRHRRRIMLLRDPMISLGEMDYRTLTHNGIESLKKLNHHLKIEASIRFYKGGLWVPNKCLDLSNPAPSITIIPALICYRMMPGSIRMLALLIAEYSKRQSTTKVSQTKSRSKERWVLYQRRKWGRMRTGILCQTSPMPT